MSILKSVRRLSPDRSRKLTFGQIYMQLIQLQTSVPSIAHCVQAVDVLVTEGLLISERVLDEHPDFPYTQHIISGLTDIGAASLMSEEEVAAGGSMSVGA